MKKNARVTRWIAIMLSISLILSAQGFASAKPSHRYRAINPNIEISENIVVDTENGLVDISINAEAVDKIDISDLEKLIEINPCLDEISIETIESFQNLDELSEQIAVIVDDDVIINVLILEDAFDSITAVEILEIIEDNNLDPFDSITIHNVVEFFHEDSEDFEIIEIEQCKAAIAPQDKWYDLTVSIKQTRSFGSEYAVSGYDFFVISVAKGQKKKLSAKFEKSLGLSLIAGAAYSGATATAGLTSSKKCTFDINLEWRGPLESSPHNSREYRVRFFARNVTVKQEVTGSQSKCTCTYTATYREPTRYAEYSIDSTIKK